MGPEDLWALAILLNYANNDNNHNNHTTTTTTTTNNNNNDNNSSIEVRPLKLGVGGHTPYG